MAPKKTNPDIALHEFWDNDERFANIWNVLCFDGEPVVRPEDLYPLDSQIVSAVPGLKETLSVVRRPDVIRLWKTETTMQILVLELQTFIDYGMALRTNQVQTFSYADQHAALKRQHADMKDLQSNKHEFLSKVTKGDRILHVDVLVLYYGEDPWDAPKTLEDLFYPWHRVHSPRLGRDDLDGRPLPTSTNTACTVVSVGDITKEQLAEMSEQVRILYEVLQICYNNVGEEWTRKLVDFFTEHDPDESVLTALSTLMGKKVRRVSTTVQKAKNRGEDMELVLDRLIDELILNRDPEFKRNYSKKLSDEKAQADAEKARADAAEAKASDEKARADAAEAKAADEKARADAAEAKAADEKARADAAEAKAGDEKARADAMAKALAGSIYREQTALGASEETIVNKIAEATGSDIAAAARWMDESAVLDS